jgi:hypothetical protein
MDGGALMHTKQTVKYICEIFPSGNSYYYKQEIITHECWDNLESLAWSTPRPISRKTFEKRLKEKYRTEYIQKQSAEILDFNKFRVNL